MRIKCLDLFTSASILLFVVTPLGADLLVTPIFSEVSSNVEVGNGDMFDVDNQFTTLNSLTTTASVSQGSMGVDIDSIASWSGPNLGSVMMNQSRQYGPSVNFSGESLFQYDFTVSEATELIIDYDFWGTTTSNSTNGNIAWWAMQGYRITVDGVPAEFNFMSTGGFPFNLPSPIHFNGQLQYALDPGDHRIAMRLYGGASGEQPGNRSMSGGINFQIGDAAIPEPSSVFVVLGVSTVLMHRRKLRH